MGASYSLPRFGSTIYCDYHGKKKATGFCSSHKTLICMTCIAEKVHFGIDCKVLEMETMSHEMKECFVMKQEILASKKTMTVDQKQKKMFAEIDKAYNKALDNLQKLRLAHLEVARQEITNIFTSERETLDKLYQAVDLYHTGKKVDADSLKKQVLMETFGNELVFQKVNPAFTALETSLEKVKECKPAVRVGRMPQRKEITGSDFVNE
ncbi:uncharacterized protein LOC132728327 [Ruditapes philippinarum]|uniref:uncharacterized protein LOC132728327 n=1 Tax=Ruditapes philippinarum TaxID=129788 RepID=UPI00295AFA20|nr:uncharacterized protein LOC132728327 [Ruditapes philippinarum]